MVRVVLSLRMLVRAVNQVSTSASTLPGQPSARVSGHFGLLFYVAPPERSRFGFRLDPVVAGPTWSLSDRGMARSSTTSGSRVLQDRIPGIERSRIP
jgi:hypothetical protein